MDLEFQGAESHLGGEGEEGAWAMVKKSNGDECVTVGEEGVKITPSPSHPIIGPVIPGKYRVSPVIDSVYRVSYRPTRRKFQECGKSI